MHFAVVLFALLCLAYAKVPLHRANTVEERVENEYIISFLRSAEKEDIVEFMADAVKMGMEMETFQIHYWQGSFATLTAEQLEFLLEQDHLLEFVSENRVYSVNQQCTYQNVAEWNLERVSEVTLDLSDSQGYKYPPSAGGAVTSYIIDTGIYLQHTDFGGRAVWGFNSIDGNNNDCHGHGTHVASTVGGTTYCIAKNVRLVAVKVLNCGGGGTSISVIQGIQWVTNNHQKPANSNMSLGGGNDPAMINAVAASVAAGVTHVVAAGNSNANACNYSPANAPQAITVGATTVEPIPGTPTDEQEDVRSSFSNYGPCTHIWAPGTLIRAAWIGNPTATNVISGTSMASPHVCGVVSLIQGESGDIPPAQVRQTLYNMGQNGIVDLRCTNAICNQSPNRLLHSGEFCENF